jgi:hypothetical protein
MSIGQSTKLVLIFSDAWAAALDRFMAYASAAQIAVR